MKQQIEQLIDRLAETGSVDECTFCGVYHEGCKRCKNGYIQGNLPVYLGDVVDHVCIEDGGGGALALLTIYWKKCGARYSLQQIFDRAEWEWTEFEDGFQPGTTVFKNKCPKQKEIRSLFELLLTLKI